MRQQLPRIRHMCVIAAVFILLTRGAFAVGSGTGGVCTQGDVRLVGGASITEGRVEVCDSGAWGTVCDDLWGIQDGNVVCRQLGLGAATSAPSQAFYGQGTGNIVLDNLVCTGSEATLFNCTHNGLNIHNCVHNEDAGVSCSATPVCTQGDVRLVGGVAITEGRIEVCDSGAWGTVCDNLWGIQDGNVVCRQLGLGAATTAPQDAFYGQGTGNIVLDNLNCTGSEATLFNCAHNGLNIHNCGHNEDAGVSCSAAPVCTQGDVRLVGGAAITEGRVEVCDSGAWGTVCDDSWDIQDGNVVCRQLGLGAATTARPQAFYGQGTGNIVLDNLACTGSEATLFNCTHSGLNIHSCGHSEDAGVSCSGLSYLIGKQSTYSSVDDEYVGPPISIPSGLPFGNSIHYKAFVGANGVISLSKPFNYFDPVPFPSNRPEIINADVVAPFWNDIEFSENSSVSVGVHSIYKSPPGSESHQLLSSVNTLIRMRLTPGETFRGKWMMVVTWNSTKIYPSSVFDQNPEYESLLSQEARDRLEKENTFQAIVITDYSRSYAIFTYLCGDLGNSGFQSYSTIGINAANSFAVNHPLSGLEDVSTVSCIANGDWNNVVYELSGGSGGSVGTSQQTVAQCWNYYAAEMNDADYTILFSTVTANVLRCPCFYVQAKYDIHMYDDPDDSDCFISRFYDTSLGIGVRCCYLSDSSSIFSGSNAYVSYIRYHPKFSMSGYQTERAFRSACCGDLSQRVCDLYHSRRSIRRHTTCNDSAANSIDHGGQYAWSSGGHHITTLDGLQYTLYGVGEYILVEYSNFYFQGRTSPGDTNGTSYFSAFVVQYIRNGYHRVQIEYDTRIAGEFYVGHDNSSNVGLTEVDHLYLPILEVSKNPSNVTVVFSEGPSLVVYLSVYGHLDFVLWAKQTDLVMPNGLLGNFNNQQSDDLSSRLPRFVESEDQLHYQIQQSWGVDSASLFEYITGDSYLTYRNLSFIPIFLSNAVYQSNLDQRIINLCLMSDWCIYEAVTTADDDRGIETLLSNYTYFDISRQLKEANKLPILQETRSNISRHQLAIFFNERSESCISFQFSAMGNSDSITTFINGGFPGVIRNDNGAQQLCYSFPSVETSAFNENQFTPLTFVFNNSMDAFGTYSPFINLCPCSSNGICLVPSDSVFLPRIGTVLNQECLCDAIPESDIMMFPFGVEEGDTELIGNDGVSSSIFVNFPFYGTKETVLYINANGVLNFRFGSSQWIHQRLPFGQYPLIAAYWYDHDVDQGGNVFYQHSVNVSSSTFERAHDNLVSLYSSDDPNSPENLNFYPNSVLVCTWNQSLEYDTPTRGENPSTFQVVLITNGTVSYVMLIYEAIAFGHTATIGFQSHSLSGVLARTFELPYSGTLETLNIDHYSNVGKKGIFVYRVDGNEILAPMYSAGELFRAYDGESCNEDVDGCSRIRCFNGGTCRDATAPETGVYCPPCPGGYAGNGIKCFDIDECINPDLSCGDGGMCVNTVGSYECQCLEGYALNETNQCEAIIVNSTSTECQTENDPVWWLSFTITQAGNTVTKTCPQNGTSFITGEATRLCMENGEWSSLDTTNCTRQLFVDIAIVAAEVFSNNVSDIDPVQVEEIIEDLVAATDTVSTGGSTNFATDLETANSIINSTLNYLISADTALNFNEQALDVIDNMLDESNVDGWQELQQNTVGSQQVILNAEGFGRYVVAALLSDNIETGNVTEKTLMKDNIIISAKIIEKNKAAINDILFPEEVDETSKLGVAQTRIPAALLKERGAGDENVSVSAVNIVFSNMEMFLPKDKLESNVSRPVTPVISANIFSDLPKSTGFETLAIITFKTKEFSEDEIAVNPRCVSWNFSGNIEDSSWSTVGVETKNIVKDPVTDAYKLECHTNHFTAFAVLMDVSGALNDTSEEVRLALSIVTYVGCSISILFLLITIIYLATLGKELFVKVHYFIHLNLAVALMLGYLVFIVGVETAVVNRGLCVFVAALLHYLFTAVFFWMLGEGIMLYLMLVKVFSESIFKKWWFFCILGWVIPVIPVIISVGIIHDQYGNDQYCWISVGDRGAIWAFVAPMLAVIVVNIFFLTAALWSVFKQRRSKQQGNNSSQNNIILFKQLFMAMIILLPLLGLTWVFGLLTVAGGSFALVFAWLFTIFNTLQGLFIFIFHVLRSEKVWNRITKSCSRKKDTGSSSYERTRKTSGLNTKVTRTSSIASSMSGGLMSESAFPNPTIREVIEEETEVNNESTDENPDLLHVDEELFETPKEDGFPSTPSDDEEREASDRESGKWRYTVTFNWTKKAQSTETLDNESLTLI